MRIGPGEANGSQPEFVEDMAPPYVEARESARDAERDLERRASGHTADESLGTNGKPLVVGDIAHVSFGTMDKSGTLLSTGGGVARVRLNGSKDPIGDAFPLSRVRTEPINGGKPLSSKAEKKAAAQHAHALAEYREAIAGPEPRPQARPSDGFDHAQAAADEMVPMPKRVLAGHNLGVSEGCVLRHLGNIRAHQEGMAAAQGRLKAAVKRAKDDGVDTKALKAIMAEMKLSTDEVVEQTNVHMAYRSFVHIPHVGPISAPEPPDPANAAERVDYSRVLGRQAGFRGAAQDTNPFPSEEDPCHAAWLDGHREAQSRLLLQGIKEL